MIIGREKTGKMISEKHQQKKVSLENNFESIVKYFDVHQGSMNDDLRDGTKETPKRYIKFLDEFLSPDQFKFTTFDSEGYDEMIVQTQIPFYSLCEHHIVPFFGFAHVGYIPDKEIVGLSKLARVVDWFSRRFQNQERITTQVAEFLDRHLNPKGVAVVIDAEHLCMSMRGIKKPHAKTKTSKLIGRFKEDLNTRNEFLSFIR